MFPSPRAWTLLLAGDIMLNSIAPSPKIFAGIAQYTKSAGLALANLEVPLTNATEATPHKSAAELRAKNQFVLKADPAHARDVAEAGFDVVSLGNNHCMDYRSAGLHQMEGVLDQVGVRYAGAGATATQALQIAVVKAPDGTRIGLFSGLAFLGDVALGHCTPAGKGSTGINVMRFGGQVNDAAKRRLAHLVRLSKAKCDVLVVAMHWGIERQKVPTDYQVRLARAWIDAGADVVWGHHPHVLQGIEVYKGKPILYSMGNLVSPLPSSTGLALLRFEGKRFVSMHGVPCKIAGGKVKTVTGKDPFPPLNELLRRRFPPVSGTP